MNAKEELLKHVKQRQIKCAEIQYVEGFTKCEKTFNLKVGYSVDDLEKFLRYLDFEYDDGFGGQELFGLVWYEDGTWSERNEYDGSEWWEYKKTPEIPLSLK